MSEPLSAFPVPALLLLGALGVDALAGHWIARVCPDWSRLAARFCATMDQRLNRADRGPTTRLMRGFLVVMFLVAVAAAVGVAVEWPPWHGVGWVPEFLFLLSALRGRASWERARGVRRALDTQSVAAAQFEVAGLTRRPVAQLDEHAVARAAIEHLAKAFDRKLVAPAFWYLLLGVPGLLVWCVVDGADQALGNTGVRHQRFGLTAARLEDALNAIPARLAGLLLGFAGLFLGGAGLGMALRAIRADAGKLGSFNMGWPVAAMAGALGLALVGPYRDGGVVVGEPWIGGGRARALGSDIGRAVGLCALAALLLALLVALALASRAAG